MKPCYFIAIDLGATSGRTILGSVGENTIEFKELSRFPNKIIRLGDHFYWNIFSLFESIKEGLKAAAQENITISSIGIDTWGVDFAFIGDDGSIMGLPYSYRDPHTFKAADDFFTRKLSRDQVYQRTGIQIMNFNSLYQFHALQTEESSQLKSASHILFMPDALSYMLTGEMVTEYTIASTSQLLDVNTRKFDDVLLGSVGLYPSMFGRIVEPGTEIGKLNPYLAKEVGLPCIPVIAVAGHDTASAVAAVPASDEKYAYLSSGTWSLMGIEVNKPIVSDKANTLNITNEGGVDGTIRFLKNITGMWLLEQCLKVWKSEGREYSYSEIVEMANGVNAFERFIDPDDPGFANPPDMTEAICDYCIKTSQSCPGTDAEFIGLIFASLAMKYRQVIDHFQSFVDFTIEKLHIIGGGSRNKLLSQMTANATGKVVIAGPSEATAIGNIMLQAKSAGLVKSLQEIRDMVAKTVDTESYRPSDTEVWNEAYKKFLDVLQK